MNAILVVGIWMACAIASAGIQFAYFQRKWPSLAAGSAREDLGMALLFGIVLGPVGPLIAFFQSGFCQYGWTLRWRAAK